MQREIGNVFRLYSLMYENILRNTGRHLIYEELTVVILNSVSIIVLHKHCTNVQ